jgi:hypothetical protein
MKTNITPTLMALMMLLAFSCGSPCNDDGTSQTITQDKFDEGYTLYIPFNGYDTLHFLRNGKDTILLVGKGKKEYFEEVFRGDGDCQVKYRLLHQTVDFYSQAYNLKFTAHYFKYSETTAFRDFYEVKMNDVPIIKPVDAFLTTLNPRITINILGKHYDRVLAISNNMKDSVYLGVGSNPQKRIIRVLQKGDVYEVIP